MATQKEVGDFVGTSERTIRTWGKIPGFPSGKGAGGLNIQAVVQWRLDYLAKLSKNNNTGSSEPNEPTTDTVSGIELMDKKARLHERILNMEIKQDKRNIVRKFYAPISIIVDILQGVSSALNSRLDSLLPKIKRAWPDIPPEAVEAIKKEVALASQELASVEPDFSEYEELDPSSSPLWTQLFGETDPTDGSGMG